MQLNEDSETLWQFLLPTVRALDTKAASVTKDVVGAAGLGSADMLT